MGSTVKNISNLLLKDKLNQGFQKQANASMHQESIFVDDHNGHNTSYLKEGSMTLGGLDATNNRSKDNPFDMLKTDKSIESDSDDELNGGRSII